LSFRTFLLSSFPTRRLSALMTGSSWKQEPRNHEFLRSLLFKTGGLEARFPLAFIIVAWACWRERDFRYACPSRTGRRSDRLLNGALQPGANGVAESDAATVGRRLVDSQVGGRTGA